MKIFNSIGHFFAWVLHTGLPKAETVAQDVQAVVESPLATAIAGMIGPKGAAVQAGMEAITGDVLKSFGAAGAAIAADGLSVQFDEATVAAIKALYSDLGGLFGKTTATPAAGGPTA